MSAYTTLETQLMSAHHIVAALDDLGFRAELHQSPQPLVGFEGQLRAQRAEVIVRRESIGSLSNDLGFARNPDGTYTAIISDFDRARFDAAWLMKLTQRYAYHVAREQLEEKGFSLVEEQVDERDTVRLTLRRTA